MGIPLLVLLWPDYGILRLLLWMSIPPRYMCTYQYGTRLRTRVRTLPMVVLQYTCTMVPYGTYGTATTTIAILILMQYYHGTMDYHGTTSTRVYVPWYHFWYGIPWYIAVELEP
jgi:hypothetical protein